MQELKNFPLSFEFFPPKTLEGINNLKNTAEKLAYFNPEYFSVTFGAGGSTREGTIETTRLLQQKTGIPLAPHLACIGLSREALVEILETYKHLGINRLVALRGDLPSGAGAEGDFKRAYELIKLIREISGNHFYIEVAAYPEFHPQAKNAFYDVFNLKLKSEAGANRAITQYFYNIDAYLYLLDECARQAVTIPIVPGIMPITNFDRLIRFSKLCGAEIPAWLYKRLASYGEDQASLKAFGIEVLCKLCDRLIKEGVPGLHFYTLNQYETCEEIISQLGFIENQSHKMSALTV